MVTSITSNTEVSSTAGIWNGKGQNSDYSVRKKQRRERQDVVHIAHSSKNVKTAWLQRADVLHLLKV